MHSKRVTFPNGRGQLLAGRLDLPLIDPPVAYALYAHCFTCNKNLRAIGRFIATELGDVVSRWELCAFNNLCADKYRRLGLRWSFADQPLLTALELRELEAAAKDELRRGTTLVGPHRDELDVSLSAMPARTHASQGEQRT